MADAQGLSPGDTGYDPTTDTNSPYYGGGNGWNGSSAAPAGAQAPPLWTGGSAISFAPGYSGAASGFVPYDPAVANAYVPTDSTRTTFVPPGTPGVQNGATTGAPTGAPTGGDLSDPAYAAQLVSWYASQPGADPSLAANPQYWIQKITSGEFGSDQSYVVDKLQNAWKTPPASAGSGGNGFSLDPSYLAPFTEPFLAPGDRTNPASAAFAVNPQAFTLPTEADLFSSPGFAGAQTAARDAVVNSNASKGLINSGGSIYDLANVTAGLEGQQYNDLVNNRANAYGINLGAGQQSFNDAWQQYLNRQNVFYGNQSNPFNKLSTLAGIGLNAAGNAG